MWRHSATRSSFKVGVCSIFSRTNWIPSSSFTRLARVVSISRETKYLPFKQKKWTVTGDVGVLEQHADREDCVHHVAGLGLAGALADLTDEATHLGHHVQGGRRLRLLVDRGAEGAWERRWMGNRHGGRARFAAPIVPTDRVGNAASHLEFSLDRVGQGLVVARHPYFIVYILT